MKSSKLINIDIQLFSDLGLKILEETFTMTYRVIKHNLKRYI